MVYTSILPKMATLALAPEIAYLGIFKYKKLSFDYDVQITYWESTIFEGLFVKIQKFRVQWA